MAKGLLAGIPNWGKKALNMLTGRVDTLESDLDNVLSMTHLATASETGNIALADNISNYKLIVIYLLHKNTNACYGNNFISPTLLKRFNTGEKSFGVNTYTTKRFYAMATYVNDIQLYLNLESDCIADVYGIK